MGTRISSLIALFVASIVSGTVAEAATRCSLSARPQSVRLHENITLSLSSSADVTAAFIDNQSVSVPSGTLTITPTSQGSHFSRARVVSPSGEFFCNADYEVTAPANIMLTGDVVSATTGQPLAGVTINLGGGTVTTTDAAGRFTFPNVPLGPWVLDATLTGYTPENRTGTAIPGTNPPIHIVMNPILPEGQIRIVLSWGLTPDDLDSHLFTTWDSGQQAHIYYVTKTALNTTLDVDDTSSYGPETVTITNNTPGLYTYAVFDYTNGSGGGDPGQVSISEAVVRVYQGNSQLYEFRPTNTGNEYTWHVFDIDIAANGVMTLHPVNRYSNTDLDAVNTFP